MASQDREMHSTNSGSTPVPDPTSLTTEALQREVASLKELLESRTNGLKELVLMRFEVGDQKFLGVDRQFNDAKEAVAFALTAQKEASAAQNASNTAAIAKSEAGFSKQIDEQGKFIAAISKSLDDKINDLKDRFLLGQGAIEGSRAQIVTRQASVSQMVAIASAIATVIGILIGAAFTFLKG